MFDLWSFLHQTAAASMTALFVLVLQHIFRDINPSVLCIKFLL